MSLRARVVLRRGSLLVDVDLRVGDGEVVALLGPNGAGKTTLLAAVAGLVPLEDGEVQVAGRVLEAPGRARRVPAEGRRLGVVFQEGLLFGHLTARENVAFGLRARGTAAATARARADTALAALGVGGVAHARADRLSGGEAQRVALARALVTEPDALLLDEPFAALDATARREARAVVAARARAFGGPVLLVTHLLADAAALADRVVVLEGGRVVQEGTPAEVARRPRTPWAARLAGVDLLTGTGTGGDGGVRLDGGGVLAVPAPLAGPQLVAVPPSAVRLARASDAPAPAAPPGPVRPAGSAGSPAPAGSAGSSGTVGEHATTWPRAAVGSVEQHGEHWHVEVRADGRTLRAELPVDDLADAPLRLGDPVAVTLLPDRVRVYPADALLADTVVVVPAGGTSRRMHGGAGRPDKTRLPLGDGTVLDRLLADLAPLPVVVVGPALDPPVAAGAPSSAPGPAADLRSPVRTCRESPVGGGPLAAVAAGLAAALDERPGTRVLVVVAGDQPFAGVAVRRLLAALAAAPGVDAAVALDAQGHPQPLLAALRVAAVRARLLDDPAAVVDAPARRLLADLRTVPVPVSDDEGLDLDRPEDLDRARAREAAARRGVPPARLDG
ncbi:ATP-binding cassette domain-containing protein [Cellulomonas endophytica]|uniref:ATP-binding cassette domain-containing protein n=1 Tax=Cellulomonas endophytica TaxID=2494735 RepID=UPI0010110133|nr:ATP-binding cassette domain-containing protein [Cellulomonas endophytica]